MIYSTTQGPGQPPGPPHPIDVSTAIRIYWQERARVESLKTRRLPVIPNPELETNCARYWRDLYQEENE